MMKQMFAAVLICVICRSALTAEPIDMGARRELFVDDFLVQQITGGAEFRLHRPQPREVVLVTDAPWEGNTSAYYSIFQDGDLYRMYYRGSHYDEQAKKGTHAEVACYAESRDGIHWTKPKLGLFEFNGSRDNNIVWDGIGTHCFTPFKDANPDCSADARYKALARGRPQGKKGLYAFKSPDGIHWQLLHPEPVITVGAFDSQNLAFWDSVRGHYADYHRNFRDGVRDIMTANSSDFVHWSEPAYLDFPNVPKEHLYTNAVLPYERAPHILLGFPTRFLPQENSRVEPTFMSSRDGRTFHRWTEAWIPEDAPQDRRGNRSNYMTWGLVQLPGQDRELSVYATEAYYTGPDSRVRRFSLRVDGFVSLHAGEEAGKVTTPPLRFAGDALSINFVTGEGGSVDVEMQDAQGRPLKGFTFADCETLQGDEIEQRVRWNGDSQLGRHGGAPVKLCFRLKDADIYSFRFVP